MTSCKWRYFNGLDLVTRLCEQIVAELLGCIYERDAVAVN